MKARAAVAVEAGHPLVIEEIDVAAPKAGEVLVQMVATGVCHTDAFTLSGDDPEGLFPLRAWSRRGWDRCRSWRRGNDSFAGRPCNTALHRRVRSVQVLFVWQNEPLLCRQSDSGPGRDARWNRAIQLEWEKPYHYMGTSTFSEYSVIAEVSLAKISPSAPLDKVCLLGCGVTTGIGAVINTAKVEPGATIAVFGLGGIGLSVIQGAVMAKAGRIIAVDTNPAKFEMATLLGATDCVNPKDHGGTISEVLIDMTDGGVDYSFECVGNVNLMREALECCHKGWGESIIIGVAGAGQEISTRPFQLVTGRVWRGTAFGGVKGRSQLPGMVDQYMSGEIKLDELITYTMPLEAINDAFEHMHAGRSIRSVVHF